MATSLVHLLCLDTSGAKNCVFERFRSFLGSIYESGCCSGLAFELVGQKTITMHVKIVLWLARGVWFGWHVKDRRLGTSVVKCEVGLY
jgi:hypothetical protein